MRQNTVVGMLWPWVNASAPSPPPPPRLCQPRPAVECVGMPSASIMRTVTKCCCIWWHSVPYEPRARRPACAGSQMVGAHDGISLVTSCLPTNGPLCCCMTGWLSGCRLAAAGFVAVQDASGAQCRDDAKYQWDDRLLPTVCPLTARKFKASAARSVVRALQDDSLGVIRQQQQQQQRRVSELRQRVGGSGFAFG